MLRTLSDKSRRLLASFLGTLLLVILLLLVTLSGVLKDESPPETTMHEVKTYTPPPSPPPPPMKQQDTQNSPRHSLARAKVENPVKLEIMDLVVGIDAGSISGFGTGGPGFGDGLGSGSGGWGIVGFSELDRQPMLKGFPLMPYPKEAAEQNIKEFRVEIHIIIDEEGRTYPVRILKTPFPSMNEDILKFASGVRFTPPMKLGVPVRTEYLWPLAFKMP